MTLVLMSDPQAESMVPRGHYIMVADELFQNTAQDSSTGYPKKQR